MAQNQAPEILSLQYDFIDNGAGDLMMVLEKAENNAESPAFYFDGKSGAMLHRRPDQFIALPYISAEVGKMLKTAEKVLVAEMDSEDEISLVYPAPVSLTDEGKLPYPPELAALTENDE